MARSGGPFVDGSDIDGRHSITILRKGKEEFHNSFGEGQHALKPQRVLSGGRLMRSGFFQDSDLDGGKRIWFKAAR